MAIREKLITIKEERYMKIDYFFPVFKEDDAKIFLTSFVKTNFFAQHKDFNMYFVVESKDKNNLDYLSSEAIRHPEYKVIVANREFSYNDAFSLAVEHFKGEAVLLGDMKLARNDLIFENCIQKKQKNASVVHVVKKRTGFKGFWFNLWAKVYNFFIKIYTGKRDRFNVISLGLIDKNIVELLQVLPNKRCFVKNTKDLKGFETRTIYISPKTKLYKTNYKKKTNALITFFVSMGVFFLSLFTTILTNSLVPYLPPIVNILFVFVIFASLILCAMNLPKHFFDCRNKDFISSAMEAKILNGEESKEKIELSTSTEEKTNSKIKAQKSKNASTAKTTRTKKAGDFSGSKIKKPAANAKNGNSKKSTSRVKQSSTRHKSTKQVKNSSKNNNKLDSTKQEK